MEGNSGMLLRGALICRITALFLTLLAALSMGFNKQSKGNLISYVRIESTDSWAFMYFTISNVVVCVYSVAITGLSFMKKTGSAQLQFGILLVDIVAVIFLFTGNTILIVVEEVAWNDNSHFGWIEFCGIVRNFCCIAIFGTIISLVAAIAYFELIMLSITAMHKRSKY